MGYQTSHHLTWDNNDPTEEQVIKRLSQLLEIPAEQAESIALFGQFAKWYESDDHMGIISREWPKTVFALDCQGEDRIESYTVFFRNGYCLTKSYIKPEFDEAEFRLNAKPVP